MSKYGGHYTLASPTPNSGGGDGGTRPQGLRLWLLGLLYIWIIGSGQPGVNSNQVLGQPSYRNVLDLAEARDGGLHSSDNWNPETCAPSSSQTTITSPSLLEFFYTNRVEAKSSKLENVAINWQPNGSMHRAQCKVCMETIVMLNYI